MTAREAAVCARVARDDLDGDVTDSEDSATQDRRRTLVEDIRVLTGVLAVELTAADGDADARVRASHRANEVHHATLRSERFALHAALALVELDEEMERG